MTKSQPYYYEDVVFQLELNLQNIRRDLIKLLEEYKFNDCYHCNRIKCYCSSDISLLSTTISNASTDSALPKERDYSMGTYYNTAPLAKTLPTPKWPENKTSDEHAKSTEEKVPQISTAMLNVWIRSSVPYVTQSTSRVTFPVPRKVLEHVNYSWPPFPKSIWSKERLKETAAREKLLCNARERDGDSSVEAFFKYFSRNQPIPKTAFAC